MCIHTELYCSLLLHVANPAILCSVEIYILKFKWNFFERIGSYNVVNSRSYTSAYHIFGLYNCEQDDLLSLKVTSAFHHVSIMRGIQCLRLNSFQPNCLRRRPTDEVRNTYKLSARLYCAVSDEKIVSVADQLMKLKNTYKQSAGFIFAVIMRKV